MILIQHFAQEVDKTDDEMNYIEHTMTQEEKVKRYMKHGDNYTLNSYTLCKWVWEDYSVEVQAKVI